MKEKYIPKVNNESKEEDSIDISKFFSLIWFRKKIIFLITLIGLIITVIDTVDKRINNPVFRGSFKLLIKDPLNSDVNNNRRDLATISDVANNDIEVDFSTLKEFLKSPIVLDKISKKYMISKYSLANNIRISNPLANDKTIRKNQSVGILKVTLTSKNPIQGEKILKDLSKLYLDASLTQRQQKIKDGLDFLNSQEPNLTAKAEKLRTKLVEFRKKHYQIEPIQEGNNIIKRQEVAEKKYLELVNIKKIIGDLKIKIKDNKLSAAGYKKALNSFGDIIKDLDSSGLDSLLLEELLNKEKKLADAKSIYTKNSKVISNLNSKISELRGIVKRNQIEELNEVLLIIEENTKNADIKLKQLNREFAEHASLIKKYNILQSELKFANSNLEELSRVKENFQLIIWKV